MHPELRNNPNGHRAVAFNKPVVFLSARVHPGEVPSSHVLNGLINFILDENNSQAKSLRENFMFKIIPCLNPDGVYRGYFRSDTLNSNLNRFYKNPDPQLQPTIYAAKRVVEQLYQDSQVLGPGNPDTMFYIDLHAHAVKQGCFIFGNGPLKTAEEQVYNQLFPKLISMNCLNFDYVECQFQTGTPEEGGPFGKMK